MTIAVFMTASMPGIVLWCVITPTSVIQSKRDSADFIAPLVLPDGPARPVLPAWPVADEPCGSAPPGALPAVGPVRPGAGPVRPGVRPDRAPLATLQTSETAGRSDQTRPSPLR